VPVVMGPSYENFRGIVEEMKAADGIAVLGENAGISPLRASRSGRDDGSQLKDELEEILLQLLTNREAAKAMGKRGRKVFEEQQGATKRAVDAILTMVKR